MKENEVPEKIYVDNPNHDFWYRTKDENSIEYTHTDTFIEKAIGWIDYNNRNGGCFFDGWEKDFKKYMKGE